MYSVCTHCWGGPGLSLHSLDVCEEHWIQERELPEYISISDGGTWNYNWEWEVFVLEMRQEKSIWLLVIRPLHSRGAARSVAWYQLKWCETEAIHCHRDYYLGPFWMPGQCRGKPDARNSSSQSSGKFRHFTYRIRSKNVSEMLSLWFISYE